MTPQTTVEQMAKRARMLFGWRNRADRERTAAVNVELRARLEMARHPGRTAESMAIIGQAIKRQQQCEKHLRMARDCIVLLLERMNATLTEPDTCVPVNRIKLYTTNGKG